RLCSPFSCCANLTAPLLLCQLFKRSPRDLCSGARHSALCAPEYYSNLFVFPSSNSALPCAGQSGAARCVRLVRRQTIEGAQPCPSETTAIPNGPSLSRRGIAAIG